MLRRTFLGTLAAGALVGAEGPLRLGMVGLVHGHASGFLSRFGARKDVELVGFAEPDREVATRYAKRFRLDPATIHASVDAMLDRAGPRAWWCSRTRSITWPSSRRARSESFR